MTALDFSPLTAPKNPAEVRAVAASIRAAGTTAPRFDLVGASRNLNVVAIGLALGVTLVIAAVVLAVRAMGGAIEVAAPLIPYTVMGLLLVVLVVFVILPRFARRERWWRLSQFAKANGLTFAAWTPNPTYASPLFASSPERALEDHLSSAEFDLGTLAFQIGARGSGSRTGRLSYVALKLDRPLPHMLLEAVGGPATYLSYDRAQRLSLEGDFDKHFTLYCPAQYERDALYIFTPDLMALLIDEASTFDVEISGSWMFAVAPGRLDLTDPAVMQRMFRIIDTVGAKTSQRTSRYTDDRAPAVPPALVRRRRIPANSRLRSSNVMAAIGFGVVGIVAFTASLLASALR